MQRPGLSIGWSSLICRGLVSDVFEQGIQFQLLGIGARDRHAGQLAEAFLAGRDVPRNRTVFEGSSEVVDPWRQVASVNQSQQLRFRSAERLHRGGGLKNPFCDCHEISGSLFPLRPSVLINDQLLDPRNRARQLHPLVTCDGLSNLLAVDGGRLWGHPLHLQQM